MAGEVIDITKPGSDDENIELGDSVPVVELDKIDSIDRWKNMPPPDTPGLIVPVFVPDEETKAAAEVLEMLQKQQLTAGPHGSLNLSTPHGKAEYFEDGGLMKTIQESVKRQKMCSSPVSQPLTPYVFTVPVIPRENLKGFNEGYLLPAEVTVFQGIYYHESGDVRPGYTGVSPFDFPLDHQGHVASKLHSGTTAYSSYIGLI